MEYRNHTLDFLKWLVCNENWLRDDDWRAKLRTDVHSKRCRTEVMNLMASAQTLSYRNMKREIERGREKSTRYDKLCRQHTPLNGFFSFMVEIKTRTVYTYYMNGNLVYWHRFTQTTISAILTSVNWWQVTEQKWTFTELFWFSLEFSLCRLEQYTRLGITHIQNSCHTTSVFFSAVMNSTKQREGIEVWYTSHKIKKPFYLSLKIFSKAKNLLCEKLNRQIWTKFSGWIE